MNTALSAITALDFYKVGHINQYPKGTELVYSNLTPRSTRHLNVGNYWDGKILVGGLHMVVSQLIDFWNGTFFGRQIEEIIEEYEIIVKQGLGDANFSLDHIKELHKLGYLPLVIRTLPEGSLVRAGIPVLTVFNSDKRFAWLTNYIETHLSAETWKVLVSSTIAREYLRTCTRWADLTCDNKSHLPFQCHDFSMRGMSGLHDAANTGVGHLFSFMGSDNIPAILTAMKYYESPKTMVGYSVPATEHSVMCAGSKDGELETFNRLLDTYPSGILSVVSDTWDLWKVVTEYVTILKDKILAREGTLVIRPDSGDPELILCGNPNGSSDAERKGVVQCLWEAFGGTTNSKGYKVLDSHIGTIYGDSITIERAEAILKNLESQGFASSNVVFGVGSYTYQYSTRDSLGLAMKATYVEINGEGRNIKKDPITDGGMKTSATGLLQVVENDGEFILNQEVSWLTESTGALKAIYAAGVVKDSPSISEVREKVIKGL